MFLCQVREYESPYRLSTYVNFMTPVNCWPTPSNDGTCEVNIEYELENDKLTLYDTVISIPLPYVMKDFGVALMISNFLNTERAPTPLCLHILENGL